MTNPSLDSTKTAPAIPEYVCKPPPAFLTESEKKELFEQLNRINQPTLVVNALIKAALSNVRFPPLLDQQLYPLQVAYQKHSHVILRKANLEVVITDYLENEGYSQFLSLLQQPMNSQEWNTEFLLSLAEQLQISYKQEPLVELAINRGKIYWRIIQGKEVLYDRPKNKLIPFNFKQAQTWYMEWASFRLFKDAGKRQGSVAITCQRFREEFEVKHQNQAIEVWNELKKKGILNKHDHLSVGWDSLSNINVPLDSLAPITQKDIKDCFGQLGVVRNSVVKREDFIAWWNEPYRSRAGLIWDHLKANNTLNSKNKLTTLKFSIQLFSEGLQPTYTQVAEKLYRIAANENYREQIEGKGLNNLYIYRPQRGLKSWTNGSGNVRNVSPKSEKHRVQLWDVGTYSNLTAHSREDDGLDLDHIPSRDVLKREAIERADAIEPLEKLLYKIKTDSTSTDSYQLRQETKNHGPQWWAIAVPRKLHVQGESFGEPSSHQAANSEHPFIKDVGTYLSILEERKKEFNLSEQDHLNAVGALRYLYRRQVKKPELINRCYATGIASQTFFSEPTDLKQIDHLFATRTKQFIEKSEKIEDQPIAAIPQKFLPV